MSVVEKASTAIAQACRALDRALMDGDDIAAANHFTDNAILGESGVDDVVGRAAILAFLQHGSSVRAVTHHELHRLELFVFGDHAVEYGWFDESKRRGDLPEEPERGRTMTLWQRDEDDVWRIHRLVISDLPLHATERGR